MPKQAPKRVSFQKKEDIIDLPNLIEIQLKSYREFLQLDVLPHERQNVGLQEVFNEIFPIKSYDDKVVLEFLCYNLDVSKYTPEESARRGVTYNAALKVRFRLTDETGIKEEEVYMGTVPLMTANGTFVINGAERVIVSQLHRSPGISFEQERHPKGIVIYSCRIIPYRGSWLEASFDSSDMIYIYVDRKKRRRKILATSFIRTLGYSTDADILEEFFSISSVKIKSEKDFGKFVGKILAENVEDTDTGVSFGKTGEKLTTAMLKRMIDAGIGSIKIAEDADETSPIIKMLAKDTTDSYESALKDFYRRIRPGEPATLANARSAMMRLFFDPKRYNLGKVGRYKLHRKLGLSTKEEDLAIVTLSKTDIIEAMKYLIRLKKGDNNASTDDIDHLGNRRVRSVGELVQNQFRMGLSRMEKIIKERINLFDFSVDTLTPGKVISSKGLVGVLKDFFGRSQLSQFMDQINPVAELTHKRRLSSLGPGGLNRERAGFEVRDVHPSHYGRICPIETPEGQNIGLITSLASYAKINELGFIETPYRIVRDGVVTDEIEYMTADQEELYVIAQASALLDEHNMFIEPTTWARYNGESEKIETKKITHMDVSSKQLVSIVTGLIPFLEHDDANRALMGSNMQRQAVPLLNAEAPIVGTGLEKRAAKDSGVVCIAIEDGTVEYVDGFQIVVAAKSNPLNKRKYSLKKFIRSNAGTCLNQTPICSVGDFVQAGDIIADGSSTDKGEIGLGKNVLVAFMSWCGYNFEDAIIISEELRRKDTYTSMYLEEFELTARDTKLGKEEITRDIPNVSEEALANLGEDGIIRVGAEVKPGDILVGKITPKSETELVPEERLLRAIFGEKAADVKDASLTVPPGTEGVVMDVKVFSRRDRLSKTDDELVEEASRLKDVHQEYKNQEEELFMMLHENLGALLLNEKAPGPIMHRKSGDILVKEGEVISQDMLEVLELEKIEDLLLSDHDIYTAFKEIIRKHDLEIATLQARYKNEIEHMKKGDTELEAGVIRQVKVYIATKRKLQVGDKMAGRHGNKGVVSTIVPIADMPYLEDGTPIEMILNPLGVPSRMNMGQLLETHLGYAAKKAGIYVKTPVFEGFPESRIWEMMGEVGLPQDGKMWLYDGRTGDRFDNPVVVGYIYMLKLSHLVADKIHARAIGPYSLVTQQPLGGKAQRGGQRFGEMEVWALEAYGAANLLQEMLTVKSDDVLGRTRIYESIVKGDNLLNAGTPESFNVLVKEMQGLGLDIRAEASLEKEPEGGLFKETYFDKLTIKIASEDVIRNEWSRGEAKKPETINYRTFKPEKGGLYCEKLFGPTKDWECACGKYKKIKNKGIVCDRCGVEVTLAKVRRERMAHIDLAVPVVHIWFFKTMPSRIGNVLGMSTADLERVIYYEDFVVIDPGRTTLEKKQLITDKELREANEKWGSDSFVAKMGGLAIRELLEKEDLKALAVELKDKLRKTKSMQARMKLAKRLKIIEGLLLSPNKADWMVTACIPVIPPELRPLVPLDGGRFATSDLNDLYRRVINRNNRLKVIIKLKTPEVIIRNEKRMLQEAVDALFDNGRHGHPVMGAGNRPLKSLSEMLKGKQGRFRQNLLGKRVDYSGRSVIVVGPELKMNQCGLPKQMALELFEPFIVKRLKDLGHVYTIRSAKKMIHRRAPIVWDVLDEIIKGHPVLLNRAPTLHRLGIQAFEPILIEGQAIRLHPLVCTAFNADFDGDQMAVHIPLSLEAQIEAKTLMMAPDNIFLPSSGKPVTVPSKDMLLGLYYLMHDPLPEEVAREVKVYQNKEEVLSALYSSGSYNWYEELQDLNIQKGRFDQTGRGIHVHEKIKLRLESGIIETTPGRVIFNTIVPKELSFQNYALRNKKVSELILETYKKVGLEETVRFLDNLKNLGFAEATKAAFSMGIKDVRVPESKQRVLQEAYKRVEVVRKQYEDGIITDGERKSKVIGIWTEITDKLSEELFALISQPNAKKLNPLFAMMDSGARGNKSQVKQLGALRGLMAKPSGEIIQSPITANFREGLSVLEYFISSHGARKGLADTALKTADSGYLTRRLVDVSQDVIITEEDCGTLNGIEVSAIKQGQEELLPIRDRIFGRCVCDDIFQPGDSTKLLARVGDCLTSAQASAIDDAGIDIVKIRSPLTCESKRGICIRCYGLNLANGTLVGLGEAIGIIAAQSIGEPGTQLTMRTFHVGGIASANLSPELVSEEDGILVYDNVRTVQDDEGLWVALNKNGLLHIVRDEGRSLEEYKKLLSTKSIESLQTFNIELGTKILISDGAKIKKGTKIAQWEQYNVPIICERPGYVKYEDLVEGLSTQKEVNKQTGQTELIVKQHRGELHPRIMIYADKNFEELIGAYAIPSGAFISVQEEKFVTAGTLLARLPRGAIKTKDITGGLPRVAELFEARRPRDAAEIAKIDGVVDFHGVQKNKRIVVVRDEESGMEEEHLIPLTKHLIVQKGDLVVKGQQITDGIVVPQEILEICGVRELQKYLVNQVQEVYRLQGVDINDKHIEMIVRQMLQKVHIIDPGDTIFLYGEDIDKKQFHAQNRKIIDEGGKPAQAAPVLLGITKACLSTDSFVSAASFQETPRVLTEAASEGKTDYLLDFKSNLIMGHMIPGGTGFLDFQERVNKYLDVEEENLLEFSFES
jgi:DNA-directed RNA polymerase beta subunit/DNA-directed RNA polymerase beta' subunit